MIVLDGSSGEGGGQILRSALSLSLLTGQSFRIRNIRSGRPKPGLMRQHLTAVLAAAQVGGAAVTGAELGSTELTFKPGPVKGGDYTFAVGTAGSTTLVLQTLLVPLLRAQSPSQLRLEGGTHNPFAPPFPFIERCFLPRLTDMGYNVAARSECAGFHPAGGGVIHATLVPSPEKTAVQIRERGDIQSRVATACVSKISRSIAEREVRAVADHLDFSDEELRVDVITNSPGPGNALFLEFNSSQASEMISSFGEFSLPAEKVAWAAIEEARRFLKSKASIGEHLADQLLIPMAMAGGGSFRTLPPTKHTLTNIEVIARFLDRKIITTEIDRLDWVIEVN